MQGPQSWKIREKCVNQFRKIITDSVGKFVKHEIRYWIFFLDIAAAVTV